jgi:succinoglycan biosynthesis protein ExoO
MQEAADIRVSVIVPAYNAAPFIADSLQSALNQTERRLEVLVIDDASRDATCEVVQRIAERDSLVRLLRYKVNGGPAVARNRGLAAARGDWIALLDADDAFLPHRLETLIEQGERHSADLVADNLLLQQLAAPAADRPMLPRSILAEPRWISPAEFVAGNIGSRWKPRLSYGFLQPLMRRRFLDRHALAYDERNRFGEDFLLYLGCLMQGARWWLVPEPMYQYRVRAGTATDVQSAADLQRIRAAEARLLLNHPAVVRDPTLARALRRHKAKIDRFYYYRAFTDAVKAHEHRHALHLLLESTSGLRYILLESLLRAPRIAGKALRGGYLGRRDIPSIAMAGSRHGDPPAQV